MPLATVEEVAEFISKFGTIRLACRECFRGDMDGIRILPADWKGISEEQSLQASLSVYDDTEEDPEPKGYRLCDWNTHLGACPDCQ